MLIFVMLRFHMVSNVAVLMTSPTHFHSRTLLSPSLQPTVPSSSTQLPGLVNFSELERISRIGSGSGSTVFKVLHRPTSRIYALKVLYGNQEDPVCRKISRHIETLLDVGNPYVIRCHKLIQHKDEIQVLLEYMDKGSLEGIHIPDEASLSDLTRQILIGLCYLHTRKIVHKDVKPSNLLINSEMAVKIADFGVSTILDMTMAHCNLSVKTIAYMSPERIGTVFSRYGYAEDTWSLGVCLLEFYLGKLPFAVGREEGDWPSLMRAICESEPPQAPPTASMEFRDFISRCLQRDPSSRWDAQQLLRHPFIVCSSASSDPLININKHVHHPALNE